MSADVAQSPWLDLPIVCPHCGNHGEVDGVAGECVDAVQLIEEVVRTWEFEARQEGDGLRLTADASSDSMDWESGTNLRIECMQCFGSSAMPAGAEVAFEQRRHRGEAPPIPTPLTSTTVCTR